MNINLPELPFDYTSINLKNVIMTIAVVYTIGLSFFLILNTLRIAAPITQYGNMTTFDTPETGSNTYCESNAECWCRNFDGTKFTEGKSISSCNATLKRCQKCLYR